jgi:hypothetical protein
VTGDPRDIDRILPGLLHRLHHCRYRYPQWAPFGIRMHTATTNMLYRDAFGGMPGGRSDVLLGLTVTPDESLPPGVWRICADDGSLLYDSREEPS